MEYSDSENYLKTVQFREAMENFQFGEWQKGLVELNELMERYPFDLELRTLNQEMQIRARIDDEEIKENQRSLVRKISYYGIRAGVIFVVLFAIVFGFQTYAGWIQRQWSQIQERVSDEAYVLELSAKFRNAQSLYQAGFYDEALILFNEIDENDPQYPQLEFYIQETQDLAALDKEYEKALELITAENYEEAYQAFQSIANKRPNFRDVLIRINDLEKNFLITDALEEANAAFQEERWDDAISGYEYLRNLDPGFYSSEVEDYLYRSYVNAAEDALGTENQTLESLKVAEEFFSRALTLRPQNPEIRARRALARDAYELRLANSYLENAENVLASQPDSLNALKIAETYFAQAQKVRPNDDNIQAQRNLAKMYLQAMDNFSLGFWDNAIELMLNVYVANPDYALGTARQTLYEAYVARARSNLIVGNYTDGLSDAQNATLIAQESPESVLRLYESQLIVAEAQGLLGNYNESVLIYQAAVEFSDIGSRALEESPALSDGINYANGLASNGDYRGAFVAYRDALRQSGEVYTLVTHKVEEGDYLTQLARKYNTTVDAILEANGLSARSQIELGSELVIPTLPDR